MDDDEVIESLPLLDERGYEILCDADGNEMLDENDEPIIANYSCMQIEPVDLR